MTTKINSHKDDSFVMTGVECAAFIVANRGKITSRLKGRVEDKDDAIAEVACKCIGIGLGTGVSLRFDKDPFATARTREQWIAFAVWQCRARLGIIHSSRNYWIDPGEDAQSEEADYRRKMVERGMNPDNFKFYMDTFRNGMPPHGGFAIGLERITACFLNIANVKEASMFPPSGDCIRCFSRCSG